LCFASSHCCSRLKTSIKTNGLLMLGYLDRMQSLSNDVIIIFIFLLRLLIARRVGEILMARIHHRCRSTCLAARHHVLPSSFSSRFSFAPARNLFSHEASLTSTQFHLSQFRFRSPTSARLPKVFLSAELPSPFARCRISSALTEIDVKVIHGKGGKSNHNFLLFGGDGAFYK
jgi:hypothetical protein